MRRTAWMLLVIAFSVPALAQAQSACPAAKCTYLPAIQRPVPATFPVGGMVAYRPVISTYVDSIDFLHVIGEVTNVSAQNRSLARISANFFDAQNKLLANQFTFISLGVLQPQTTTCYHLLLKQPPGWAEVRFEPITTLAAFQRLPALTVLNSSGSLNSSANIYTVIGQVRNDEAVQVKLAHVIGTLFDAGQIPIGCELAIVNSTDLAAGQTSSFSLPFTGLRIPTATSYRLQTDGNLQ